MADAFMKPLPKLSKNPGNPKKDQTYLRNQHSIPSLNTTGDPLPILIQTTWSNSQDLRLIQLFDGGLGQEDAGCGLGLGFDALHEDAVEEWCEGADGFEGGGLCGGEAC